MIYQFLTKHQFFYLILVSAILSGCVYIKSHEYNAAPFISGNVYDLGKPVSNAKVILEYTKNEETSEIGLATTRTDKQGRFELGPVKSQRKGLFIYGPTELLVRYKLSIVKQEKTYLGIKSFGYWDNKGKLLLDCELSRSAHPNLTHPDDLATRCKSPKTPKKPKIL